ncbi:uncharacterized protein LOC132303043 isoform X3 [Cornus florida]|uniref:uncharacterized protein LOC132303043 isoform X3 n=1 Tax=Cornus florida TaxID=4283 RepID=UPI00289AF3DB|nr:uncharacterized protein LOC132303043 isoform X3 [Cornus florida]XP_059656085.1 uncharacterized protein LOC132303043 isoform X3 [Cornus florida]XP_059656086.1 uncharacterized protein LOC132303043 isoform X3 [Cornus florida]XP_059656087.1 uncharacterized protein LOC132303043 isoform X3 [Cornus florida]XP_059656088.1 uncharacterized protein LOC132303043 isoform X3 [Cornus florida]
MPPQSSEMSGQANSGGSDDGRSDDEFKFNTTFEGSGHESPQNGNTGGKDSASSGSGDVPPNGDNTRENGFAQNTSLVLISLEISGQANSGGGSDDGGSDNEFKFNITFDTVVWIQFVALVVGGLSLGLQYLTYLDEYESKKLARESLMQGENL